MGYYSSVYIHCDKKAYEKLSKVFDMYSYIVPGTTSRNKEDNYFLSWSWTKWYEDEDDVKAVMDILYELDENEEGYYGYLRIGEDSMDTEYRFNDDRYELYPIRSCSFDEIGYEEIV